MPFYLSNQDCSGRACNSFRFIVGLHAYYCLNLLDHLQHEDAMNLTSVHGPCSSGPTTPISHPTLTTCADLFESPTKSPRGFPAPPGLLSPGAAGSGRRHFGNSNFYVPAAGHHPPPLHLAPRGGLLPWQTTGMPGAILAAAGPGDVSNNPFEHHARQQHHACHQRHGGHVEETKTGQRKICLKIHIFRVSIVFILFYSVPSRFSSIGADFLKRTRRLNPVAHAFLSFSFFLYNARSFEYFPFLIYEFNYLHRNLTHIH